MIFIDANIPPGRDAASKLRGKTFIAEHLTPLSGGVCPVWFTVRPATRWCVFALNKLRV